MADDWIKDRACLVTSPRFSALVRRLREDPNGAVYAFLFGPHARNEDVTTGALHVTLHVTNAALQDVTKGALLRVWHVVNQHGKPAGDDAILSPMTTDAINDFAGIGGFAEAMEAVGFLSLDDQNTLRFKHFLEHNELASTRKRPKTSRERVAQHRARKKGKADSASDVTNVTKCNARLDKIRIDKKPPYSPPPGDVPRSILIDFSSVRFPVGFDSVQTRTALEQWLGFLAQRGKTPLDPSLAVNSILLAFSHLSPTAFERMVYTCIANGWANLREVDDAARPAGPGDADGPPAWYDDFSPEEEAEFRRKSDAWNQKQSQSRKSP